MSENDLDPGCDINAIRHSGIVTEIDDQYYYVTIVAQSACAACEVKGVCNVSEMKEEIIEVPKGTKTGIKVGDKVEIMMEKSLGTKAVLLGYFVPFLILLVTLVISMSLIDNEGLAGVISIIVLIPYYLVLYFKRENLKRTFEFRIR